MPLNPSAPLEASRRRLAAPALLSAVAAAVLAGCATEPTTGAAPAAPATAATATAPAAGGAPAAAPLPRLVAPSNAIANAVRSAPAPAGAASGAAAAGPRPPVPGAPPVFTEVVKDAKSTAGYLTVWTKDEKTWLEIPANLLDKPLFFSTSLVGGMPEGFLFPGLMGSEQVVVLRRVGNSVQMVARNLMARAPAGTPLAQALEESYSDSLLASAPLAAAPHVDRKSLLVDANALLGGDITGTQTHLEVVYRMPYTLDRGNSSITRTRTTAEGTAITFRSHFAVPKLPPPPVFNPAGPPPNPAAMPNPPRVVPDPRSFFLSTNYNFRALPVEPMKPRLADQRVGYFTDAFFDFGNDGGGDIRTHQITRWRLEKKDPAAALSEPKDPIRVVMDRNIPEKWRAPIKAGILEWNKAFERAGFQNAVVVEQQPADADWATTDGERLLAVRWFAIDGPGATAVGPSLGDPRTGEILRGAAIIPENWVRFFRNNVGDTTPRLNGQDAAAEAAQAASALPGEFARRFQQCSYGEEALQQAQFGFELLSSRGALDPNGPEAERYIADSLKDVTMHEVGHALGLRHNFRASTGVTRAQLRDPAFTAKNGVSNSVMDYNALNLPLEGETVASYHMATLGAYDLWAIEYGYKQFPPGTDAATEKAELAKLAAQSATDGRLAYATDEDVAGIDPRVNQRDLGDNPQAFAQRQLKLARELWTRTQKRELAADDDFSIYRRNLQRGLNSFAAAVPMLTKYVGGTYTSRALAGANQPLLVPVPAAEQRTALDVLLNEVFASQSFKFDPAFMSRLGVDHFGLRYRTLSNVDFSLSNAVLGIQRGALDNLMGDTLAAKFADAEFKVANPKELLSYAEVQQRISQAVWAELKGNKAGDIDSLRRNLQREHLRRVAAGVLRSASMAPADVRGVHRQVALQLESQLKAALASPVWNATAKAHLADSLATLGEALKAPLVKQGV